MRRLVIPLWMLLSANICSASDPVIGLYAVPMPACSLVAAAGFTAIHSYDFETQTPASVQAYISAARRYLDAAQSHDLRVLLGLPRSWVAERDSINILTAVHDLKKHPALLIWYEDELAQSGDRDGVAFLDTLIRRADPQRGLAIEEGIADKRLLSLGTRRMFTYYPVQQPMRERGWLFPLTERFEVAKLRVPFWPVLQAYGQDLIEAHPKPKLLAPTAPELQYTLFSSLIAGASGLFFYTWSHTTLYDADKEAQGQWAYGRYRPLPEVAPTLWHALHGRVQEARTLMTLLDDAKLVENDRSGIPAHVEMRRWQTSKGELVLLANPAYTPAQIEFDTAGALHARLLRASGFGQAQTVRGTMRIDLPGPGGVAVLLQ